MKAINYWQTSNTVKFTANGMSCHIHGFSAFLKFGNARELPSSIFTENWIVSFCSAGWFLNSSAQNICLFPLYLPATAVNFHRWYVITGLITPQVNGSFFLSRFISTHFCNNNTLPLDCAKKQGGNVVQILWRHGLL